jgi:hypothetical protein
MLQTGDLLLVRETPANWALALLDGLICRITGSPYSHVGMVLRDPPFVPQPGLYVWESGWENGEPDPQDGRAKLGVQLTPWARFVRNNTGDIYVRRRSPGHPLSSTDLLDVHHTVYGAPYDANPLDWLLACWRLDIHPQKLDRFWCSAFVAYVLVRVGTLPADVDWSVVRPGDLSSHAAQLDFLHPYEADSRLELEPGPTSD